MARMETPAPAIPKSLFVFSIFYGGMVCIAGVLGNKLVALGPLSDLGVTLGLGPLGIEAGICAFLLLVILSSAIAELHGGETATRLVRWGFVPLIVTMGLIELVLRLPPAAAMDAARLAAFETILGQSARLMLAGLIAYGTSQTLNVTIFAWLKGNGFHPVSVDQIIASRRGGAPLPPRAVLLTFDDAYESQYSKAFPLLRQYGYPALVAVVSSWTNASPQGPVRISHKSLMPRGYFMSWSNLREMAQSGLVEIASHTHDMHYGAVANPQGNELPAASTHLYLAALRRYETDAEYEDRVGADLRQSAEADTTALRQRVEAELAAARGDAERFAAMQRSVAATEVAEARQALAAELTSQRTAAQEFADNVRSRAEREAAALQQRVAAEVAALRAEAEQYSGFVRASAERETGEMRAATADEVAALRSETEQTIAALRLEAETYATELRSQAERETTELRERTAQETSHQRDAAVRVTTELRDTTQREATELTEQTQRDVAELRESTRVEVERLVTEAQRTAAELTATAKAKADALVRQTEQALAEAELSIAARHEEAERSDADRHATARGETERLVRDAEAHATEAEQRVAKALEQAEKVRIDAETHAKELLSNARRNADRVVAEAREHAENSLSEAMTESERERTSAQRQVEDLNRQRESITSYLDELRNLLGNDPMPSKQTLERAQKAASVKG